MGFIDEPLLSFASGQKRQMRLITTTWVKMPDLNPIICSRMARTVSALTEKQPLQGRQKQT